MKNIPRPVNGFQYTATEIMAILDKARSLGVSFLKVEGFEATWAPIRVDDKPVTNALHAELLRPATPPAREPSEGQRRAANLCTKCGSEKSPGKYGKPYCVRCFVEKKESEENRG